MLDAQAINFPQVHVVRIVGVAARAVKIDLAEIAAQADVAYHKRAPVQVVVGLAGIGGRQIAHAHGDGRNFVGGRVVVEEGVVGGGNGAHNAHVGDGGGHIGGNVDGVRPGGQVKVYAVAVRFAKGEGAVQFAFNILRAAIIIHAIHSQPGAVGRSEVFVGNAADFNIDATGGAQLNVVGAEGGVDAGPRRGGVGGVVYQHGFGRQLHGV